MCVVWLCVLRATCNAPPLPSQDQRNETARLTRQTSTDLQRMNREAQHKLTTRLDEVEQGRVDLRRCVDDTQHEIDLLEGHKGLLVKELAAKDLPLKITNECRAFRDKRYGIDLVADAVDQQLGNVRDCVTERSV